MPLVEFDTKDVRNEAERLNGLGYLYVMWEDEREDTPTDVSEWLRALVIGFAIDADDRECFLLRTTNPGDGGRFVARCIPVDRIVGFRTDKGVRKM